MRAFIMLALFGSMALAATLNKKGGQDTDRQYYYGGYWGRSTNPLHDSEDPKDSDRMEKDSMGEGRVDLRAELRSYHGYNPDSYEGRRKREAEQHDATREGRAGEVELRGQYQG